MSDMKRPARETSFIERLATAVPPPAPPAAAGAGTSAAGGAALAPALSDDLSRHGAHLVEDLRVWPEGALPDSTINVRAPDFAIDGFNQLKAHLYSKAETKNTATSVTFDIRVQDGELGYYLSRGGRLHLLNTGRHLKVPGSRDSTYHVVSLNTKELHLPEAAFADGTTPQFHLIRVDPGEIVTGEQGGSAVFLSAGTDSGGQPCPGYHLFEDDRSVSVSQRVPITQPIVQQGSSYIINVNPGFLCKALVNRTPVLLGTGQHQINVAGFSIPPPQAAAMVSINDPVIRHGQINIVRVGPGQKLAVVLQGKPKLLPARPSDPYIFNDPTFRLAGSDADSFARITDQYISHQTLHEIRLDQGEVALVWLDNRPYVLGSHSLFGDDALTKYRIDLPSVDEEHRIFSFDSPTFRMATIGGRPAIKRIGDERAIQHGTIHIIRVAQGHVCRVFEGSQPRILEPRDDPYIFNSPVFRMADVAVDGYPAFISQAENVIEHGIFHIITVPSGQACRVWHDGDARILGSEKFSATRLQSPGDTTAKVATSGFGGDDTEDTEGSTHARRYVIESSNFRLANIATDGYDAWVSQADKTVQHGSISIVTVEDGEVAIVRNQGKRQALGPGRYILESPKQVYETRLYTGVRTTPPEDIVTYDSQRIPIRVTFTVTFEITSPARAAQYQGEGGLNQFLQQACHSALRSSVNETHLLQMGRGGELRKMREREQAEATAREDGKKREEGELGTLFDEEPADNGFAEQFHAAFERGNAHTLHVQLERVGVNLIDLSIQDWAINDDKVVTQLESLAMQTVEAQVNNAKFKAQAQAAQLQAEGQAAAMIAEARGKASVSQATIDAENAAKLSRAKATLDAARIEAQAMEVKAKAESAAVIQRAEAEAKAISMRGEAEAGARKAALEALVHTPAPEWMRQLQEACSGVLAGANISVVPEGLTQLYSMLSAGGPLFSQMRAQAMSAGGAAGDYETSAAAPAGAGAGLPAPPK